MIERTKDDLKNFNSLAEKLRTSKLKLEKETSILNNYEIKLLERDIKEYELKIKMIKISLGILSEMELQIIIDSYFEKITSKNIAIKLNISSDTLFEHKRIAIEGVADVMYCYLDDTSFKEIPKENKRRSKPLYQYDLQGNFIKKWNSANECEENGFYSSSIYKCCAGSRKQYKRYKWSHIPLVVNNS